MRILTTIILSFMLSLPAFAGGFECIVVSGAYKSPGESGIFDAKERDPTVSGSTFTVARETGKVSGSSLFSNQGDQITIVRDTDDLINTFEVMSKNSHNDIKLLKIDSFEGRFTFKYYFGWLGLFITGDCSITGD